MKPQKLPRKPWLDVRPMTNEEAARLISTQFPQLMPVSTRTLGEGWDNHAFLVNEAYVFRFPRRQLGAECLSSEIRVTPSLAERLPLPISAPIFIANPSDDFPWQFAGYPYLPGKNLHDALPDVQQRSVLAQPLGEFLRELHALGREVAIRELTIPDTIRRLEIEYRVPRCREQLVRLVDTGLIEDSRPWLEFLRNLQNYPPQVSLVSVLHGDLYSRHVLVGDSGKLSGVIDWGDVHFGSVAIDLAIAFQVLPNASRKAFFDEYGSIDDDTLRLCRFRTIIHTLNTTLYSDDIGDDALLTESLRGLRSALE